MITFSFDEGFTWYLDNISVIDTSANTELMNNGDFETGSLNAYCVCSGRLDSIHSRFPDHSGSYVYDARNMIDSTKLSQALNTIPGRNYNVSFWLNKPFGFESPLKVYMSKANQNSFQMIFLLLIVSLIYMI